MIIGEFGIFERTNSPLHINILSWHRDDSITWRFVLSWHPHNKHCTLGFYKHGRQIGANIPLIGDFNFQWQEHMWRRSKTVQVFEFPHSKDGGSK